MSAPRHFMHYALFSAFAALSALPACSGSSTTSINYFLDGGTVGTDAATESHDADPDADRADASTARTDATPPRVDAATPEDDTLNAPLVGVGSGKCFEPASMSDGAIVSIQECQVGKPAQRWIHTNAMQLKNIAANKCMDAASSTDITPFRLAPCDASKEGQRFVFATNGEIRTIANKCVNVASASTASGAWVIVYGCSGSGLSNERFDYKGAFYKRYNNGTVSCNEYCSNVNANHSVHDYGKVGTCLSAALMDSTPVACSTIEDLITDVPEVVCRCDASTAQ